jgi:hypothetical protein
MIQFSEEITINTNPEHVFNIYKDVPNWNRWDPEVASSSIDGQFIAGTQGKLKPTKGPNAKMEIVSVKENTSFTVQSRLPLCIMTLEHDLFTLERATRVIHRVKFNGLLSFFFGRVIGNQIKKGLSSTLRGLKKAAETNATKSF